MLRSRLLSLLQRAGATALPPGQYHIAKCSALSWATCSRQISACGYEHPHKSVGDGAACNSSARQQGGGVGVSTTGPSLCLSHRTFATSEATPPNSRGPKPATTRTPTSRDPKQSKARTSQQDQHGRPGHAMPSAAAAASASAVSAARELKLADDAARQAAADKEKQQLKARWHALKPVTELTPADLGKYYDVEADCIREGLRDYYQEPASIGLEHLKTTGGCKGLVDEFEASRVQALLFRECMHRLINKVESREQPHVYLDGLTGSGKSVAMAALVHYLRCKNWLVLYVPSAQVLIEGGFFYQCEQDDLWDTPDSAKLVMKSLYDSHQQALKGMKAGETDLASMIETQLASSKAEEIVRGAVDVISHLTRQTDVPVLVAIDEYNVLHSHTGYHEWPSYHKRQMIRPERLRLAAALRLLEKPALGNGVMVGASSYAGSVSPKLPITRPAGADFEVARFSKQEMRLYMAHLHEQGVIVEPPDEKAVNVTYHLTAGNPTEVRKQAEMLQSAYSLDLLMGEVVSR